MNQEAQSLDQKLQAILRRAVKLQHDRKHEEAEPLYRQYLALRPRDANAWALLAALLRSRKLDEPSIAANRKALQLDPALDVARKNLANIHAGRGEFAEAEPFFRAQYKANPDNLKALHDFCATLRCLGRNDEVIEIIGEAETRIGSIDKVVWPRALSNLAKGNYEQGFKDYEHRYISGEVDLPDDIPWTIWRGEDLKGKSILIIPEQGFGDAIVMSRFLPQLKALGPEITMHIKPPLRRLFSHLESVDHVIDAARKSHKTDYYLPNMSLPHRLGLPGGKPPPMPRLHIPEDSRARARALTSNYDGIFKIGVVWVGSSEFRANARRSTNPLSFLSLSQVPGVQLFSLYKGEYHQDFLDSGMAGLIVDACGNDRDFADSAALIDEMDLMITTDTAVVHIAATLGKPVWNLLNREGFWLYGEDEHTPWYPSMRLFRQTDQGGWPELFNRVEAELRTHLQALKK
jgi:hypothetical protein